MAILANIAFVIMAVSGMCALVKAGCPDHTVLHRPDNVDFVAADIHFWRVDMVACLRMFNKRAYVLDYLGVATGYCPGFRIVIEC